MVQCNKLLQKMQWQVRVAFPRFAHRFKGQLEQLAQGYGLGSGLLHVSLFSVDQKLPGDVAFMANEWQVNQSPAKSCNTFQVSTCITSTTFPCQSK